MKKEAQRSSETRDTFYQATQDYVLEDSSFKFKVKCFALLNALNSSHIYLQTCIANNVATSTWIFQ
jgi:hypothetical protein